MTTCGARIGLPRDTVGNGVLPRGAALYRRFNGFGPARVARVGHPRIVPPVLVELGDLIGLIYRSSKGRSGAARTFIHLMEYPPGLMSNTEGTQLYVVGGSYHVTERGIEDGPPPRPQGRRGGVR
jgi:hypothetical protein